MSRCHAINEVCFSESNLDVRKLETEPDFTDRLTAARLPCRVCNRAEEQRRGAIQNRAFLVVKKCPIGEKQAETERFVRRVRSYQQYGMIHPSPCRSAPAIGRMATHHKRLRYARMEAIPAAGRRQAFSKIYSSQKQPCS